MGYQLSAVLARTDLLRAYTRGLDHAVIASLRQNMALLPVTQLLIQELTGSLADFNTGEVNATEPFQLVLSPALASVLASWSEHGPVAYVEAELGDDISYQSAMVWLAGAVAWGPRFDASFDGPRDQWPLNAALGRLGVIADRRGDRFTEVGLDVERDTTGWLAYGRRRRTPAYYDSLAEEWERQEKEQNNFQLPAT